MQLAVQAKYSAKKAFQLRLKGNYEQAEAEIERAFDRFVWGETVETQEGYAASKEYQKTVLELLSSYIEREFRGKVLETSSTMSFFL
jgi:hypothetical protein